MIKIRLIRLLSHSGKYIGYQVFWQWVALFSQIAVVMTLAGLLESLVQGNLTEQRVISFVAVMAGALILRFISDRRAARASWMASADVKQVLRTSIYEKLLRIGASYQEKIATSEVVQMCTEGVEQLETYFGRYLPQLLYSLLAPLTLFVILFRISWRASLVLLCCVPLIPVSIVAVQEIAKKLLNERANPPAMLGRIV